MRYYRTWAMTFETSQHRRLWGFAFFFVCLTMMTGAVDWPLSIIIIIYHVTVGKMCFLFQQTLSINSWCWKMTLSTASPMPFNASTCNCNCQQTRNVEQSSWQYRIFKFRMYYIQFQVQVKCWLAFHSISRRVCDLAKLDANTTRRYFRVESVISILSLPHTTIALTWFTIIIDHIHRTFTILDCAIFRLNASHCRIYQCALA